MQGLAATPVAPAPLEPAPSTHQVTSDGRIEADDERIRSTIQYAKGYAKACKELGLDVPADVQARLHDQLAARRSRVHKRVRRTVAAAAAISAGAVGMNAAAAYFTANGSGSGAASVGTVTVTVAAAGTPSAPLYPGSSGDVKLKINNPNAFAVKLKTVTGNGAITADAGHSGCSPTGVTFNNQTGLNVNLPASTNNIPVDLSGAASMSNASASGCQGATFTIPVSITVQTS